MNLTQEQQPRGRSLDLPSSTEMDILEGKTGAGAARSVDIICLHISFFLSLLRAVLSAVSCMVLVFIVIPGNVSVSTWKREVITPPSEILLSNSLTVNLPESHSDMRTDPMMSNLVITTSPQSTKLSSSTTSSEENTDAITTEFDKLQPAVKSELDPGSQITSSPSTSTQLIHSTENESNTLLTTFSTTATTNTTSRTRTTPTSTKTPII